MRKAMSIFERLGISEQVAELPTELAGRTDMFRPGKKWDPHFLHRTGEKSDMDAVGGFLSYANYMSEVLHHVDDIQKLRTFSDQIRAFYRQILGEEPTDEEMKILESAAWEAGVED